MTIGINEKPSLLAPLLAQEIQARPAEGGNSASGAFSGKLDAVLAAAGQPVTGQTDPQSLAEALKLQMLHTTLSLAGDTPGEPPLLGMAPGQSPALQALVRAYGQPAAAPARQPSPHQPLPEVSGAPGVAEAPAAEPVARGTGQLDDIIAKASARYGVDSGLIKAVIKAESDFKPTAVSRAGARGLMQLMPATARSLGVSDPFDPEQNVMAGTRFLRDLLSRYNGDLDSALAAYNWGPGNVDKRPDRLPRETRDYLVRVKQLYASYTV